MRIAAVVLGLCLVAGLTAALGYLSHRPTGARDRTAAAQRLLDRRAAAVRRHDRASFLTTISPSATAYRTAQRRLFANLRRLPLAGWHYTVTAPAAGDSAMPDHWTARVRLVYRLRGFDRGPVTRTVYVAFTRRAGGWRISGAGRPAGRADTAAIWTHGRLRVARGRSCLVLGVGSPSARLRDIARRTDAAVRRVDAAWPDAWTHRAVVLVPHDGRQAARLVGRGASARLGTLAALATVLAGPDGTPPPGAGDRVVLAPAGFARLSGLGRDVVLTHELTHVATRRATTGRTPYWLVEGFADYVGYRDRGVPVRTAARELATDVSRGHVPTALPADRDFTADASDLPQSYEQAWLACRMVARRYGEKRLIRLYRAAAHGAPDRALRRVLGVDRDRFTARWRTELKRELE